LPICGDGIRVGSENCVTGNYECTVPIRYFAEATDAGPYSGSVWRGRIVATDAALATGAAFNDIEILTLSALDVSTTIIIGKRAVYVYIF
jgi:hypothetical protein